MRVSGEQGFTLVEVMVVTALMAIIFTTVALYYSTTVRLWGHGNDQTEMQQQARIALGRLVTDLQQATLVNYDREEDKLELKLPRRGGGKGEAVAYYRKDHTLIRWYKGGANPIAQHITSLEYDLDPTEGFLFITLTAAKGQASVTLETGVGLRNLGKGE